MSAVGNKKSTHGTIYFKGGPRDGTHELFYRNGFEVNEDIHDVEDGPLGLPVHTYRHVGNFVYEYVAREDSEVYLRDDARHVLKTMEIGETPDALRHAISLCIGAQMAQNMHAELLEIKLREFAQASVGKEVVVTLDKNHTQVVGVLESVDGEKSKVRLENGICLDEVSIRRLGKQHTVYREPVKDNIDNDFPF